MIKPIYVSLALALLCAPITAHSAPLKAYKDRLFAYPQTLKAADNGNYRIIDYQEGRDIDERDQIPERRVKNAYVDLKARRATKTGALETSDGALTYYYAGKTENASVITLYIHGKGGSGKQGINDYSFGGNFNRIKMLMLNNNGLYLSPDAGNFTKQDVSKIVSLIIKSLTESPNAKLILGCGSSGGEVCYDLVRDKTIASRLGGIALMGSFWNPNILQSAAGRARVPIYIAHGSKDSIFKVDEMKAFYQKLRQNTIPARMVRFENGIHGTPIRMMDWREAINWMLIK